MSPQACVAPPQSSSPSPTPLFLSHSRALQSGLEGKWRRESLRIRVRSKMPPITTSPGLSKRGLRAPCSGGLEAGAEPRRQRGRVQRDICTSAHWAGEASFSGGLVLPSALRKASEGKIGVIAGFVESCHTMCVSLGFSVCSSALKNQDDWRSWEFSLKAELCVRAAMSSEQSLRSWGSGSTQGRCVHSPRTWKRAAGLWPALCCCLGRLRKKNKQRRQLLTGFTRRK